MNGFNTNIQKNPVKGFCSESPLVFVSDFWGTLYEGSVMSEKPALNTTYLAALVNLHRAGHTVVLVSSLPEDANQRLQKDSEVIEAVFDDVLVPEVEREAIKKSLLVVHDFMNLRAQGISKIDVCCDDSMRRELADHPMAPHSAEFEAFIEDARINPFSANYALLEFVDAHNEKLEHANMSADVQRWEPPGHA